MVECSGSDELSHGSSGATPPDLKLKEAIACRVEALCEEEIMLAFGIDMRDPPRVAPNLDGLREPREMQSVGPRLQLRRYRVRKRDGADRYNGDRE